MRYSKKSKNWKKIEKLKISIFDFLQFFRFLIFWWIATGYSHLRENHLVKNHLVNQFSLREVDFKWWTRLSHGELDFHLVKTGFTSTSWKLIHFVNHIMYCIKRSETKGTLLNVHKSAIRFICPMVFVQSF